MQHIWLYGSEHTQAIMQTMKAKHRPQHAGQRCKHTLRESHAQLMQKNSVYLEPLWRDKSPQWVVQSPFTACKNTPSQPHPLTHILPHTQNNKMFCQCWRCSPSPPLLSAGISGFSLGTGGESLQHPLKFSDLQSLCYYETSTSDEWLRGQSAAFSKRHFFGGRGAFVHRHTHTVWVSCLGWFSSCFHTSFCDSLSFQFCEPYRFQNKAEVLCQSIFFHACSLGHLPSPYSTKTALGYGGVGLCWHSEALRVRLGFFFLPLFTFNWEPTLTGTIHLCSCVCVCVWGA